MNGRGNIADCRLPMPQRAALSVNPKSTIKRPQQRPWPLNRRCSRAYTIIEVMMAMGIFVIGFTAVISLFPTAMVVQREIADDLVIQRVVEQATAVLRNKPVTIDALHHTYGTGNGLNLPLGLYPLPSRIDPDLSVTVRYLWYYPVADRSYPSSEIDPSDRRYFWVPMVRKLRAFDENSSIIDDWMVYIFVMRVDQPYGGRTVPNGPKNIFTFWYNQDPDFAAHSPGFIPVANLAPFTGPAGQPNPNQPEQPYVPRICMIEAEADDPDDLARRLVLGEGNLVPNGTWQVASQEEAERDPTHYKIHPGDLIVDQFGTVHTVLDADHESITLRDPVYDPTSADDTNGWVPEPMANGDAVYIWYVPAAAYGTGTNYAQFEIGPAARSPLRAVVAIPGAVR